METPASSSRKLFQTLVSLAIQRCRLSEKPCRLSVALKCFRDSNPSSIQISISDTGVGTSLMAFGGLDFLSLSRSNDKWDGVLSITTTGICDKDIHHFRLNLREAVSSRTRLCKLPPAHKNNRTFSGTEICLSTMEVENFDDFVVWVIRFVRKVLILKALNLAVELLVESEGSFGSERDCILQEADGMCLPHSMTSVERLVSGLEDYVLKHRNIVEKECQSCFVSRGDLKVGYGQASSTDNIRGTGQIVEAVIVIAARLSQPCHWGKNCLTTQVLQFQDFTPCTITQLSLKALTSIDWQSYGLRLRGNFVDEDGHAVFEWEEVPFFACMDIVLHSYHRRIQQARQQSLADRNLVKKAVKIALDGLKSKYPGLFLSSHALKIREYAPDLSRTVAGLISSSNDSEFQGECAALLGLHSIDVGTQGLLESRIREKIIGIIEMNDTKPKVDRVTAPCLFESPCDEEFTEEDDGSEEDFSIS